jgi:hypothetical protein
MISKEITSQCYKEINGNVIRKHKMKTMGLAIKEANRLNRKPNMIHEIVPYQCAICGFYHVGKSSKEINKDNNIYQTK